MITQRALGQSLPYLKHLVKLSSRILDVLAGLPDPQGGRSYLFFESDHPNGTYSHAQWSSYTSDRCEEWESSN